MKKAQVSFDSVVLAQEKKEQIDAAICQLKYHSLIFKKWGFEEIFEKGTAVSMIFYGGPGTGKTLMAEAIANQLGQELLMISPAEIETQVPGGAERNIKRYFKIASGKMGSPTGEIDTRTGEPKTLPPKKHVMLFDECDSLITDRKNVGMILAGQINTILSELERFEGVVIFTTNRMETLDPAIERRLSAKIEFDFPNEKLREAIWKRMIPKKAPLAKDVDFKRLAESFQIAGGNIKNAVLTAAREAAYRELDEITFECFVVAANGELESCIAFEKAMKEHDKKYRMGEQVIERRVEKTKSGNEIVKGRA